MSASRIQEGEATASAIPPYRILIREMMAPDVATVALLEARSFSTPWKEGTFRTLLVRPGAELWVAELEEQGVIGYYVLWCIEDQGELANIAVREDLRGLGVGSRLLAHVIEIARDRGVQSLYLEVRESNDQAAAMYKSHGFIQIGVRRNYYDRPREDARVLMKRLDEVAAERDAERGGA